MILFFFLHARAHPISTIYITVSVGRFLSLSVHRLTQAIFSVHFFFVPLKKWLHLIPVFNFRRFMVTMKLSDLRLNSTWCLAVRVDNLTIYHFFLLLWTKHIQSCLFLSVEKNGHCHARTVQRTSNNNVNFTSNWY